MLLVLNSHHDLVEATLPECPGGRTWSLVIDTNIVDAEPKFRGETGAIYGMTGRSLAFFVRTE
jgi:glycogen operon protein